MTLTVFSRLNAGGVYLKLGLVDPAFIRTWHLFGARRLYINGIFQPSILLSSELEVYWLLRTKFEENLLKNVTNFSSQWGWLSHISKNITDRNSDWTLLSVTFLRETLWKWIGNCSTVKLLCKQFRTRWCEVPVPSVLPERQNYGMIQETAGETLERP